MSSQPESMPNQREALEMAHAEAPFREAARSANEASAAGYISGHFADKMVKAHLEQAGEAADKALEKYRADELQSDELAGNLIRRTFSLEPGDGTDPQDLGHEDPIKLRALEKIHAIIGVPHEQIAAPWEENHDNVGTRARQLNGQGLSVYETIRGDNDHIVVSIYRDKVEARAA